METLFARKSRARSAETAVGYGSVAVIAVTLLGGYVYYCVDKSRHPKGPKYAPVAVVKDGNA